MDNSPIINFIFSFVLMLIGLMFIEGIWRKKGKIIKSGLNIDNLFFSNLQNKKLLKAGDQIGFLVCLLMSLLTLINGLLMIFFNTMPNISAIFIFIAVILSWPIRILYIYFRKDYSPEKTIRVWPFSKI